MAALKNRKPLSLHSPKCGAALEKTLDEALRQIGHGLDTLSVTCACKAAGRSRTWATENGIGTREKLLSALLQRESDRVFSTLSDCVSPVRTRAHYRAILEALLGDQDCFMGRLQILRLLNDTLTDHLANTIGVGRYHAPLGGGILGVVTSPTRSKWRPTYQELLATIEEMTWAVVLFEVETLKRMKP